jgi:hypothetical protein
LKRLERGSTAELEQGARAITGLALLHVPWDTGLEQH